MADSKDKKTPRIVRSMDRQPAEASPNPHGEGKLLQMPIRTDQKRDTRGQNIASTPNTVGGRMNPSVAHEFPSRSGALKDKPEQPKGPRQPATDGAALDTDPDEKNA